MLQGEIAPPSSRRRFQSHAIFLIISAAVLLMFNAACFMNQKMRCDNYFRVEPGKLIKPNSSFFDCYDYYLDYHLRMVIPNILLITALVYIFNARFNNKVYKSIGQTFLEKLKVNALIITIGTGIVTLLMNIYLSLDPFIIGDLAEVVNKVAGVFLIFQLLFVIMHTGISVLLNQHASK